MIDDSTQARVRISDYGAAALLVLAMLGGAALRTVPGVVGVFHDDAVYAATARSLAAGEGYRLPNVPGRPLQTKYPILVPAVLAAASRVATTPDGELVAMQRTTAALGAAAIALVYLFCVSTGVAGRAAAFAACLLMASSSNVLFYCAQPLSELPFLLTMVVGLWNAESFRSREDESAPGGFACGALLALPTLCRVIGLAFPLGAALVFAAQRRRVLPLLAGAFCVAAPWFAWTVLARSGQVDAVAGYQTDYLGWWTANASASVLAANVASAMAAFPNIALEGIASKLVEWPRWTFVLVGALPWLVLFSRTRELALLATTLILYVAAVCCWPWPPDRFVLPLLPVLAAVLFEQLDRWGGRLGAATIVRGALAVVFVAVFASNALLLSRYVAASRESGYPYFVLPSDPVAWSQYRTAFTWLREHSHDDDVLAAGFDTMTALYTGRAVVRPFVPDPLALYFGVDRPPIGSTDDLASILKAYGVRYLLLSPMPAYPEEQPYYDLVYATVDNRKGLLRPVWQSADDPRFVIFAVEGSSASPPSGT